jgi:hypothetical protein
MKARSNKGIPTLTKLQPDENIIPKYIHIGDTKYIKTKRKRKI